MSTQTQQFNEIMAQYGAGQIGQFDATKALERIHIRGGFGPGQYTGYDYRDQTWREARWHGEVAMTRQGTQWVDQVAL